MNDQELHEKVARIGFPEFSILPGQEEVPMLIIEDRLICGASYAYSLSDEDLRTLITETLAVGMS